MKDLKSAKDILTEWGQQLQERATMSKKTTAAEQRIRNLEERVLSLPYEVRAQQLIVETLCEIARQLARIGDIYEFELGVNDDYKPNLRKPDRTTLAEIFRPEEHEEP